MEVNMHIKFQKIGVILSLSVLITLSCAAIGYPQSPEFPQKQQKFRAEKYAPKEIIVKFKPGVPDPVINLIHAKHRTVIRSTNARLKFERLKIPTEKTVLEMVELYQQDPNVEYAEPNYIAHAHLVPNDEYYRYQWHLDNPGTGGIHMEPAWDISSSHEGVVVAVVDTGVAYENYSEIINFYRVVRYYQAPDLARTKFVAGYDFVNNDTHPNDDEGHGTHVTGTIAQSTNNSIGVAGIAFDTSVMPVKVLDSGGSGTYADVADGIIWAADNGADVINLSLGGPSASTTLMNACVYASNKGVTLVCSAGNDGEATLGYPAAYDQCCIAVGATRYDEAKTFYSNFGNSLDIMGPGGDLNVDQNNDGAADGVLQQTFGNSYNDFGYWLYQGTSMAAPHVSGVAALIISTGVAGTPAEVREVLQSTAKDLGASGWDPDFGWGLVDALAALSYNATPNTPPVADPGGPYAGTEDTAVQFDGSNSSDADGDPLAYAWNFGDGTSGSGVSPVHTFTAGGTYTVTLMVNDGKQNSPPQSTTAEITEINDPPVSNAGGPYRGEEGQSIQFNGSGSYDPDGSIASYAWDFGDASTGSGVSPSHTYSAAGSYTVSLTVTDDGGLSDTKTAAVDVTEVPSEIQVFYDSFEVSEWNGLWSEDSQNDWFRSSQRATHGSYSAEVDGQAVDASLTSLPINLQGKNNATITFSWLIEWRLDSGEYIAFDVSTDGGNTWVEKGRLRGNVDAEDQWHAVTVELNALNRLILRFRGRMSASSEDANVDQVKVVAW